MLFDAFPVPIRVDDRTRYNDVRLMVRVRDPGFVEMNESHALRSNQSSAAEGADGAHLARPAESWVREV